MLNDRQMHVIDLLNDKKWITGKEMAHILNVTDRTIRNDIENKKGEDVCAIDISAVSVLADYFVIANGNSDSQVRALVENVEEKMHKAGYAAKETEGHRSGAWVLIDFGDVIVHIFDRENRQFYNLERIWNDGKRIDDVNEF